MGGDQYERVKKFLCDLVDVEKKHGLRAGTLVELTLFEGEVSYAFAKMGSQVLKDWIEVHEKHGLYVDKRIREVLERFPKIKEEALEKLKKFYGGEMKVE